MLVRKRGTPVYRPVSDEHPDDESIPGVLVLRPEGRVFFANAEQVGQKMRTLIEAANPRLVVLDLGGVFDIEYTALKMLVAAERSLAARGIALCLVGLNPRVLAMIDPLAARRRRRARADVLHGTRRDRAASRARLTVGSTDITFQSCSTLAIDYRFTAGENAGRAGTLHLARLSPVPAGCVD